jgi:flavin-dependent thymidylate synthase
MNVELLSYTPDALNLLLKTKGTRLKHEEDVATWDEDKKQEHLQYMLDTIKSSWEFVDYTFSLEGVTRAFTHQLVRTRTGSYAQEAMRVIDASGFSTLIPPSVEQDPKAKSAWIDLMDDIGDTYEQLDRFGIPRQDARGVLPTNVLTNIICKFNLRTLNNMAELRLCTRTQGEYQQVFREMRRLVIQVHPWAEDFINVFCVNHAHCAFPRYGAKECPIYPKVLAQPALQWYRREIKQSWENTRYEARPIAVDGKAM